MNVLITGVSSGIGYEVARMLVKKGHRVFGTVRKEEDAIGVKREIGSGFHPLICDITNDDQIQQAFLSTSEMLQDAPLHGLVNNAGVGIGGPILYQPLQEIRQVMEVNFFGTIRMIQTFLPLLKRVSPPGHARIIMISSVAGKIGYPFLGAYVASKHAIEGLSDSLRRECLVNGIQVIVIEPGDTRTAIWDKAELQNPEIYRETEFYPALVRFKKMFIQRGKTGIPVEKVAEKVVQALESGKPKTRYLIPNGWFPFLFSRYLPDRWVDKVMQKVLRLYPPSLTRKMEDIA